jgi:hypothetical protein
MRNIIRRPEQKRQICTARCRKLFRRCKDGMQSRMIFIKQNRFKNRRAKGRSFRISVLPAEVDWGLLLRGLHGDGMPWPHFGDETWQVDSRSDKPWRFKSDTKTLHFEFKRKLRKSAGSAVDSEILFTAVHYVPGCDPTYGLLIALASWVGYLDKKTLACLFKRFEREIRKVKELFHQQQGAPEKGVCSSQCHVRVLIPSYTYVAKGLTSLSSTYCIEEGILFAESILSA